MSIPMKRGYCPPPIRKGSDPPKAEPWPAGKVEICIGDVMRSLNDVEEWIRGIRQVLAEFPKDCCVCIEGEDDRGCGAKP